MFQGGSAFCSASVSRAYSSNIEDLLLGFFIGTLLSFLAYGCTVRHESIAVHELLLFGFRIF